MSGRVHNSFDDVAVLANTGFDHGKVTALEPWPTQEARPFSAEYIAGHLCRTYDKDVEACLGEARQRMDAEIDNTIRSDIGGTARTSTGRTRRSGRSPSSTCSCPSGC